jgi:hypothetical protein
VSQTTAVNQFQIVSAGSVILESGKPTLFVPADTSYYTLSRAWNVSLINPQLFYVGKISSVRSVSYSGHWIDFGNRDNVINANHFINAAGDSGTYTDIFQDSRPKYGTFNANINQRYLECYENESTTTTRYLNGISRGSNSFTVTTPNNLLIGGSSALYNATGTLQEIIIYSSGNSANRTGIETNINSFYSIY